jgi:hypothetical protein
MQVCWFFLRVDAKKKDPALKPIDSVRGIQWAEAHCSLWRGKSNGENRQLRNTEILAAPE